MRKPSLSHVVPVLPLDDRNCLAEPARQTAAFVRHKADLTPLSQEVRFKDSAGAHDATWEDQRPAHRFRAINTLLGNFKMWMNTTFRGFKTGHYAPRYLAEFQYRFNRRFDLAKLMPTRLASCAWQRPASEAGMRTAMAAELATSCYLIRNGKARAVAGFSQCPGVYPGDAVRSGSALICQWMYDVGGSVQNEGDGNAWQAIIFASRKTGLVVDQFSYARLPREDRESDHFQ